MTSDAASRIQSAGAKAGNGGVSKGSFASRAQSAAATNAAGGGGKSSGSGNTGKGSK